jgi:indolepyruvate ferredoxin oxidoreductase beta subunit
MIDRIFNVLMVGVGGQGIVLASDILAEAAMMEGLDVKKSEIHGMAMRGGPVFSHVRFGRKVFAPVISKGAADIIFALESMEALRFAEWAKDDAVLCCLAHNILPTGVDTYPTDVMEEIDRLYRAKVILNPSTLKQKISSSKVENSALLGALSTLVPLKEDSFLTAMAHLSPKGTFEINRRAFEVGRLMGGTEKVDEVDRSGLSGPLYPSSERSDYPHRPLKGE